MPEPVGVVSHDLWSHRRELSRLLGQDVVRAASPLARCGSVLGWDDARGASARRLAALRRLPFRPVRVGPLGFVRPGPDARPTSWVLPPGTVPPPRFGSDAAASGLATLRRLRLAWRNDGRDRLPFDPGGRDLVVAVVGADRRPEEAALGVLQDRPAACVVLMSDSRLPPLAPGRVDGAIAVARVNPWALFDLAAEVHAPPGDLADLARLAGRPVSGARTDTTDDVEALFARRFLDEPVYLDAWSREPTDFATAADQLAWLRDRFLENDRRSVLVGISRWKAAAVARFLDGPDGPAVQGLSPSRALARAAAEGGRAVAWETRMPARLEADAAAAGIPLLRMEDGFLRSVGLGAAFLPGASCVLDERGIYYDPRRPSDLEHILATATFDAELIVRARALRAEIVALRLSKYNVGREAGADPFPAGRRVVLVPGQVEDDASVLLGSPAVPGNLALLRAARRRNPDAFILFKPHPDVEAGLRRGKLDEAQTAEYADRTIRDVSIVDLLDRVDTVETMTSLAGFEALMRGRETAVHGRPFYAGWGLTADLDPPERRGRKLTLDELVAGALILYPRYLDPVTGQRCPPEILVRRLAEARDAARRTPHASTAARALYVRARHALLGPVGMLLRRARGAVRKADRPAPPR